MTKTSIKHEALLPDGSTATRTSEKRTYSHAIAFRLGYAETLAFAKNPEHHSDVANAKFYLDNAAGKNLIVLHGETPESIRAEALEELSGATTVAEYVAANVAKRVAKVEEMKASGEFEKWAVDGWASRADLAEKTAAKVAKYLRVAEVRIVPAKIVAKKGGAK